MDLLLGHKEALQRCQRGGRRQAGPRWRAVQVVTRDPSRGHSEPVNAVPMLHSSPRALAHKRPLTILETIT